MAGWSSRDLQGNGAVTDLVRWDEDPMYTYNSHPTYKLRTTRMKSAQSSSVLYGAVVLALALTRSTGVSPKSQLSRILQGGQGVSTPPLGTRPPSGSTPAPITEGVQEALDDAKALWYSKDYEMYELGFRRECYCEDAYRASYVSTVEGGTIVEVTATATGAVIGPGSALFRDAYSVEKLFDMIQSALDNSAYEIRVQYDGTLGYPVRLYIDYDIRFVDEEIGIEIESLAAIERDGVAPTVAPKTTTTAIKSVAVPTASPKATMPTKAKTATTKAPKPTKAKTATPAATRKANAWNGHIRRR
jgi:Family of unknown function (DUF6174)